MKLSQPESPQGSAPGSSADIGTSGQFVHASEEELIAEIDRLSRLVPLPLTGDVVTRGGGIILGDQGHNGLNPLGHLDRLRALPRAQTGTDGVVVMGTRATRLIHDVDEFPVQVHLSVQSAAAMSGAEYIRDILSPDDIRLGGLSQELRSDPSAAEAGRVAILAVLHAQADRRQFVGLMTTHDAYPQVVVRGDASSGRLALRIAGEDGPTTDTNGLILEAAKTALSVGELNLLCDELVLVHSRYLQNTHGREAKTENDQKAITEDMLDQPGLFANRHPARQPRLDTIKKMAVSTYERISKMAAAEDGDPAVLIALTRAATLYAKFSDEYSALPLARQLGALGRKKRDQTDVARLRAQLDEFRSEIFQTFEVALGTDGYEDLLTISLNDPGTQQALRYAPGSERTKAMRRYATAANGSVGWVMSHPANQAPEKNSNPGAITPTTSGEEASIPLLPVERRRCSSAVRRQGVDTVPGRSRHTVVRGGYPATIELIDCFKADSAMLRYALGHLATHADAQNWHAEAYFKRYPLYLEDVPVRLDSDGVVVAVRLDTGLPGGEPIEHKTLVSPGERVAVLMSRDETLPLAQRVRFIVTSMTLESSQESFSQAELGDVAAEFGVTEAGELCVSTAHGEADWLRRMNSDSQQSVLELYAQLKALEQQNAGTNNGNANF